MLFSWFPVVCPFLDAWIGKQSRNVRKKQFFGAWKIVFPQSFSFLQVIVESNVSGPQVHPNIDFAWIGSSPEMCEKNNFRSLKNCFSAKPQFSSRYCGKQCFRSPSLPKYWFCVDWKQSKHVRKKNNFSELEKLFFLQSPISSHKTIRGHATKNEPQRGIANLTYKQ